MRIVFTGGGTGGHFYPLIAVGEQVRILEREQELQPSKIYFFSTDPINQKELERLSISFKKVPAGRKRLYSTVSNIIDTILIPIGIVMALIKLFFVYPDVVFSKGGYASFPTLFAARILHIPVIIHDSDTIPGRVSIWAGKFARNVALSWEEAASHFPEKKVAVTGQPIRDALLTPQPENAYIHFGFTDKKPILAFIGGSQGAQRINQFVLDNLQELLKTFQIIHQTGESNFEDVTTRARVIVGKEGNPSYKALSHLSDEDLAKLAAITHVIVSRSGSFVFEIAQWGIPSILIPLPENISRDQRTNAYVYARSGGARVIEEENLTQTIFLSELRQILDSKDVHANMGKRAHTLARDDAGRIIAQELITVGISHGSL